MNQQLNPNPNQRERDRRQPYNYGVKPDRPIQSDITISSGSSQPPSSDLGSSRMLQIVTSMSQRISESENDLSKLSKVSKDRPSSAVLLFYSTPPHSILTAPQRPPQFPPPTPQDLSSLTNNQASVNMKLASFPTMQQMASLKQQFESNTTVMNEAATNANQAHVEVNKLGLQLFEQNTKVNSLVELGKDFDKSSMQLDSLRLEVDELKGSQPMLKSIDNDVSQFRREFHARLAEESEFR